MILVDTSVWIEFLKGHSEFQSLAGLLDLGEVVTLGAIFGELLQGARTKHEVSIISQYWSNLKHLDSSNLWYLAGLQSFEGQYFTKGIGLVDASLITAARKHQCRIWTLDKKLLSILRDEEIWMS